jgi:hypothetical protein
MPIKEKDNDVIASAEYSGQDKNKNRTASISMNANKNNA